MREIFLGLLPPLLLATVLICYFIPTIIARSRQKANYPAIFALNLLTGWTFIGWVVALVWAMAVERVEVTR